MSFKFSYVEPSSVSIGLVGQIWMEFFLEFQSDFDWVEW